MKKIGIFVIVTVILILGLVFLFTQEGPTPVEDSYDLWEQQSNEKIVFSSRADSPEGELYLLDNAGEISRLTNNERHEANPALSPNGEKVAFHAGNENNPQSWGIYILNLETSAETRLTNNNLIDGHPDWSPDGSKIIFTSFRDSQGNPSSTSDIYVINTDGTGLNRLTTSEWDDADAEWSPDGSKIVFKSTRNTQQQYREEIYVMDNDGSDIQRLTTTSDNESDHDPSWSPDSKTIVFNRYEGSRLWIEITELNIIQNYWQELTPWNVYKTDLNGNVTKLTDTDNIAGLPIFFPQMEQKFCLTIKNSS
ncbi:hypothetical protein AKJ45_03870 [candidate division MSBL1 archaeon SCGC-AAA261F19]|uniref:DUF5050 domain-containing protein n=1 Tax=candidate division MSBL1 archaeon SCGC-AAA261F19 TaxID=1698275 RepID=A0A133V617_9EURY|nr:hypothetical protein AKJ45_03870 [candidate division MSBL1 archaeon SCGC-AAA261F19]